MDILGSRGCKAYEVKWTHASLTHLMNGEERDSKIILDKILAGTTDKNLLATIP